MPRNLTVQLDEETISKAKVLAAKKGTSVSALITRKIAEMTDDDERYERAKQRALRAMDDAKDRGGVMEPWTRDELHDRSRH